VFNSRALYSVHNVAIVNDTIFLCDKHNAASCMLCHKCTELHAFRARLSQGRYVAASIRPLRHSVLSNAAAAN
jgi:hypothetical protein